LRFNTISPGLCVVEMPCCRGNILRQNTALYTSSAIMTGGNHLNGIADQLQRTRSLITRMKRSISGTCSSRATT
ncbi:MAG: hypothetical protein ACK55Z_28040, partial [bacterium]